MIHRLVPHSKQNYNREVKVKYVAATVAVTVMA